MVNLTTLLTLSLSLLSPIALAAPKPPKPPGPPGGGPGNNNIPLASRPASEIITKLGLVPNPDGGHFLPTFQDPDVVPGSPTNRSLSTAFYYLLQSTDGSSPWHRVDQAETWHFYAGAPIVLSLSQDDGSPVRNVTLGIDLFGGEVPQYTIPRLEWQRARSLGAWTLVGNTVAPGFVAEGFEIAAPGWTPSGST